MSHRLVLVALSLIACKDAPPVDDSGLPDMDFGEGPCAEKAAELGVLYCAHQLPEDGWATLTRPAGAVDQVRATKYLVSATSEAPLPSLFVNVNELDLHYDLLTQVFPEHYGELDRQDYMALVVDPQDRSYYAGNLAEYIDPQGGTFFGFTIWDDPADAATTIQYEDALKVYEDLLSRIDPRLLADRPLTFVPNSGNQRDEVSSWTDAPFPIRGVEDGVEYEAYTVAVGYGTVRLFTLDELARAEEQASFGFQDLLILEEAPFDIERVIAGAVTGSRQGELSHLNVRSAARGTPNCFVKDALVELAAWEGQLARLECGVDGLSVQTATLAEAEAFWEALRPDPVSIPPVDLTQTALTPLWELPTATADERRAGLVAYGAKGTNLAVLTQRVDPALTLDGFLTPFLAYHSFLETGVWWVDLGLGEAEYSFAETLAAWHEDPEFLTDGALRRERLEALRDAMEDAPQDPALLDALAAQIIETFGSDTVMVRLRSSSNAEDGLEFSGAGLYQSESACAADETDGDAAGPSRCDPDTNKERTLSAALGEVFASVWTTEAWEEREWYGVDHLQAEMAVLVNTRSKDEQANIVAFTGNPNDIDDDRLLVNAQLGAWDVVSAEPGVVPEKVYLTVSNGVVTKIERVSPSSQVESGEVVLTDAQLEALGAALAEIVKVMPLDHSPAEGRDVVWDTEWKVLDDGRLIVKQIRPFQR